MDNFIDLQEVKKEELTLQRMISRQTTIKIDQKNPILQLYYLDEYRNRLQDDNINFMNLAEPVKLDYLNLSDKTIELKGYLDAPVTIELLLSSKVYIQNRVVYDLFMMLGEVGGLRDFIALFFSTFMTSISQQFLLA